jgi:four helix bundle protein
MAKEFDLEKGTLEYARAVIRMCKELPRSPMNDRLVGQVVGSAGSIGADYREANDSLGKRDFLQRIRISRREAKESLYWLELISEANSDKENDIQTLMKETEELKKILSAIILKMESTGRILDN